MREALAAALAAAVLFGCAPAPPSGSIPITVQPPSPPTPLTGGWFPGELLDIRPGDRVLPSTTARRGTTPEGFAYQIYTDGSGGLDAGPNHWSLDCAKDKMTDRRNCKLNTYGENKLFVCFTTAGTPESVCILGHDFPGRTGAIRVDSLPPVSTDREGCLDARRVMQSLLKGNSVTVRFYHWPYDYSRDASASLLGFARAVELAAFIVKNIDNLSFSGG